LLAQPQLFQGGKMDLDGTPSRFFADDGQMAG